MNIRPLITTLLLVLCMQASTLVGAVNRDIYQDLPFEMSRVTIPTFANNSCSIAEFGAKGDGVTLNTQAFAKAIEFIAQKGGGTVVIPRGVWLTGPIILRDNINLHAQAGALILFSTNFDHYPIVETIFEGLNTRRCMALIYAKGCKNIAITGSGVFNGQGEAWRPVKKGKMTSSQWSKLIKSGGVLDDKKQVWYPSVGSLKGQQLSDMNVPRNIKTESQWLEIRDFLRPVLLNFVNCEQVLLQGVTFENSPCWTLHPIMCSNITIDQLTVRAPWYAQNGDGLDLESCTNAVITNSTFDVGDDAICIKSGKDKDGRDRNAPCQNVLVDNCVVYHGHGGFVVGSEMSGGVKNVKISNCMFIGTDVGLRFKSVRGRGGVVENIYINDIQMSNIMTEPLLFDLYYGGKSAVEALEDGDTTPKTLVIHPVTEETPTFKNIFIKDITCSGALRAMYFNGLPEMKIENIVVENATITATKGAELNNSKGVVLKNLTIHPASGAAIIMNSVSNVDISNITHPTSSKTLETTGDNKDIVLNGKKYHADKRMAHK